MTIPPFSQPSPEPDIQMTPLAANTESAAPARTILPAQKRNFFGGLWRIVRGDRKVAIGLSIIVFFILLAIIGPFLDQRDPNDLVGPTALPPSAQYWLGTTSTGQDVFAQLMAGTRTSVLWGIVTGIAVMVVSVLIGLTAGYMGGLVDDIITLFINIFLLLPGFPLALILASMLPFKGMFTISLVLVVTGWSFNARVLRAQTLSLRNHDFVEAARTCGESTWRIIFFEVLPNELSIVAGSLLGTIIYAIMAAVGLQFLGLGRSGDVSWGTILFWAQNADSLGQGYWWWIFPPGLCVAIFALGLTLLNFGIDEISNPSLRNETRKKSKANRLWTRISTHLLPTNTTTSQ